MSLVQVTLSCLLAWFNLNISRRARPGAVHRVISQHINAQSSSTMDHNSEVIGKDTLSEFAVRATNNSVRAWEKVPLR